MSPLSFRGGWYELRHNLRIHRTGSHRAVYLLPRATPTRRQGVDLFDPLFRILRLEREGLGPPFSLVNDRYHLMHSTGCLCDRCHWVATGLPFSRHLMAIETPGPFAFRPLIRMVGFRPSGIINLLFVC